MIETGFSVGFGVKGTISIENCVLNGHFEAFVSWI